ncbi:MAG TPA: hypothetical protein VKB75_09390 [Jatrophihabitans sp.]|nr:hypothetical protein [Jatrophihabitans sp.]
MTSAPVRGVACLTALSLVAACTSKTPAQVVTVTVPPSTAPSTTTTASPSQPANTNSSTPPGSSSAAALTKLNGACDTLLPDDSVLSAIGATTLGGKDVFVVGKPEPNIGRIGYLNCRYGVKGTSARPAIEIGISLYTTAAKAADRITATVDDYTGHGATSNDTTVAGQPATLLTGGVGAGYDVPLLVVASGQRTVAVSIASSVATGSKAGADATALAKLALERTAQ